MPTDSMGKVTELNEMRPIDFAPARTYFNQFVAAFATFHGDQVAKLFVAPVLAMRSDGALIGLAIRGDVVSYYQAALDKYHRDGCRSCRWSDLSVTAMGSRVLLAAVTWDLLREDETVVTRWRQSYGLSLFGGDGPKAFPAVSHAAD